MIFVNFNNIIHFMYITKCQCYICIDYNDIKYNCLTFKEDLKNTVWVEYI